MSTIGHLSTSQLPIGMTIQPAQAYQSLAPPLVPTSAFGSTLSTSVMPTYAMTTPSTNVAMAMLSTSVGAETRPTYVSLGVPLTSAPPLVSATAVPSGVTTASAPPPLPPVSQDPGIGGPMPSRTERRLPCLSRICVFYIGRLGPRLILNHLKQIHFCDVSSSTA